MPTTETKDYTITNHRNAPMNPSIDGNNQNDPGKGVVLGTIGGTIIGGLAGGPIGAVVGAVAGAAASGVAVAMVDSVDNDDSPDEGKPHSDMLVGNVVERDGVTHPVIFHDTKD